MRSEESPIVDLPPATPSRTRWRLWGGVSLAAVVLVSLPLVAVILQLARGYWPGEGDPDNGYDDLASGTVWRTRAVELVALAALVVAGVWVARSGFARLRPRAFHAVVLVAAGLAVSLPGAVLVTNTADAAVADHLDDAWTHQLSSTPDPPDLPAPSPPSPALARVLWHPANPTTSPADRPGLPGLLGLLGVARGVSPDACAVRYGATDAAYQAGFSGGVSIIERVLAFPDSHHAAAYVSDPLRCRAAGETTSPRSLPLLQQADSRSAWTSTDRGGIPVTYVRMRFGSIVITGGLLTSSTALGPGTPSSVTQGELVAAATMLAAAARP